MHCPECGHDLNGLEKNCREEFDKEYGQYFRNLQKVLGHQWYWRGAWIGLAIDLVLVCFIFLLGNWSWNELLGIINRAVSEKDYTVFIMLFFIPLVIAVGGHVIAFHGVFVEEEQRYERFKETWGLKHTEVTKEVL